MSRLRESLPLFCSSKIRARRVGRPEAALPFAPPAAALCAGPPRWARACSHGATAGCVGSRRGATSLMLNGVPAKRSWCVQPSWLEPLASRSAARALLIVCYLLTSRTQYNNTADPLQLFNLAAIDPVRCADGSVAARSSLLRELAATLDSVRQCSGDTCPGGSRQPSPDPQHVREPFLCKWPACRANATPGRCL